MKIKEFILSEKIKGFGRFRRPVIKEFVYIEDIKEFIKLNNLDLQEVVDGKIFITKAIERIMKRAGDKLT